MERSSSIARFLICTIAVLLLVNASPSILCAQQKFEKEYRIDRTEVPAPALDFLAQLPVTRKVRWYREIGLTQSSIEAKTKINGERYSIEFNVNGQIEDVEIERPWESVPGDVRSRVTAHLAGQYRRHKVTRVQFQYTGQPADLVPRE
ncbi:MAG: hypothetical protein R3330_19830, partial [Saprospiraceae bacterium]|nr:hypothetical protein [Saprospiraceae bacterium]